MEDGTEDVDIIWIDPHLCKRTPTYWICGTIAFRVHSPRKCHKACVGVR